MLVACLLLGASASAIAGGPTQEIILPEKTDGQKQIAKIVKEKLWNQSLSIFDKQWATSKNGRWVTEDLGIVFCLSPIKSQRHGEFSDTETRHKFQVKWNYLFTEAVFITYTTFDHYDDGDNTYGWIEDECGNVVAEIDDNDIYGGPLK